MQLFIHSYNVATQELQQAKTKEDTTINSEYTKKQQLGNYIK